jgi:lambda family phage minor tail protein L
MPIANDIASLSPSARIELLVLDASAIGGDVFRFHEGTNELQQPVVWQGQTYLRLAVRLDGFEASTSGALPRPTLTLPNFFVDETGERIYGYMSVLCSQYRDLQGAQLIRKVTSAKYLDAINFANGNPSADPTAELPDEIWYIDRKADEADEYIKWELASALDLTNVTLPSRPIVSNLCPAPVVYRDASSGCTWAPDPVTGPFFDVGGNPTSAANDGCSRRLNTGCRVRFGNTAGLPFGGFPGAGLVQR